jgi:hypothetical protein
VHFICSMITGDRCNRQNWWHKERLLPWRHELKCAMTATVE